MKKTIDYPRWESPSGLVRYDAHSEQTCDICGEPQAVYTIGIWPFCYKCKKRFQEMLKERLGDE